jgi:hypothetical protein
MSIVVMITFYAIFSMSTAESWIIYHFVFAVQKLDMDLDSKEMGWEIKWFVETL